MAALHASVPAHANRGAGVTTSRRRASIAMSTCMDQVIGDTLADVTALNSPVVRSCHVGNNTSNVWGWLALARNSQLLQFDHTRYGRDENCLPWTQLADRGRIAYCVDQHGQEQPAWIGKHVLEHLPAIPHRYHGYMNYQIPANDSGDLMRDHYQLADTLSQQINGNRALCDTAQITGHPVLLAAVIDAFARRRQLHLALGRWIRRAGADQGKVISMPIRQIEYGADGRVTMIESDGRIAFAGPATDLAARLLDAARQIAERLRSGTGIGAVDYPWFTLELAYFFQAVIEHSQSPRQTIFWHAGGSSSQYYINAPAIRARLRQVRDVLGEQGLLPTEAVITVIPTFCCQLFATAPAGLSVLDGLIADWLDCLARHRDRLAPSLRRLQVAIHPAPVAMRALRSLEPVFVTRLHDAMAAFNAAEINLLPVAHCANLDHPSYNKFGTAQSAFLGKQLRFPCAFHDLRWGEAELLVKLMAAIVADEVE
jgi:hypothetical protein